MEDDRFKVEVNVGKHWSTQATRWGITMTHNGNQWTTMELYSIEEVEKLIKALQIAIK